MFSRLCRVVRPAPSRGLLRSLRPTFPPLKAFFRSSTRVSSQDQNCGHEHGHHMVATVQQRAPQFTETAVVGHEFKEISLSDYKGKYVVLFFYPLDFTFVCPTEITAFSDRAEEFRAIGTELLACSTDSKFSHLAWIKQARKDGGLGDMKNPISADITKCISNAYGVLLPQGFPLRGLFIIDPNGILRISQINDLPIGRSVDETLRLVKALQYNAKHGEVCPANWQPGSPTMKDDPEASKAYFKKHAK